MVGLEFRAESPLTLVSADPGVVRTELLLFLGLWCNLSSDDDVLSGERIGPGDELEEERSRWLSEIYR